MVQESVPNQRNITINKARCDKKHLYTVNNLDAIDEAAKLLQSKGGFKLYMYLAKNQDKHNFMLSSKDFMIWSGLSYTGYTSAFADLVSNKFLIAKEGNKTVYIFYDRTQIKDKVPIEVPEEKVAEIKAAKEKIEKEFVF